MKLESPIRKKKADMDFIASGQLLLAKPYSEIIDSSLS